MFKETGKKIYLLVLGFIAVIFFVTNSSAETSSKPGTSAKPGSEGAVSGSGTITPDLFTGTMSYSIPIEVPAGRHGMQPNLALTYSSSNGNGWVGAGWDLDVGAIERSARKGIDYYGDDFILRIAGSAIDIVNVKTDIGYNEYRAKIENGFLRIKQFASGTTNSYWEVTDKSGTKYFYGQTAASRQDDPADSTKIFKWCLDRVEDTNGNYMLLSYDKNVNGGPYEGQIYLKEIRYTFPLGAGITENYIKFYLGGRTDAPDMYSTNFRVKTAYRLKTIEVRANNNPVRAYKLVYDTDPNGGGSQYSATTGRSLLTSVQQFGKDATVDSAGNITNESSATKLPSIELTASTGANSFLDPDHPWSTTTNNWNSQFVWAGDFNGDGKMDLAAGYPEGTLKVWLANADGTGFITPDHAWSTTSQNWTNWVWTGDFNGDGKTDIASGFPNGTIKVWLASKCGSIDCFVDQVWTTTAQNWYSRFYTWAGDFNGDGKTDIAVGFPDGILKVWLANADGTAFITPDHAWSTTSQNWTNWVWTGDFNGDGKTDIASGFPNGTIKVWLSNGSSFVDQVWTTTATNWYSPSYTWAGDFNGDGKTDIAVGFPDGTLKVWISSGSSFITPDHAWSTTSQNWTNWVWTGDFNGDGKTDIASGFSNGTIKVWLSNGSSFVDQVWTTTATNWYSPSYTWAGDFNGDGKTDLAVGFTDPSVKVWQSNVFPVDLLTSVSNGVGGTTTIAYKPSTQYTNTQLPFPVQTVSSIATNDGVSSTTSTTTYEYSGGFYHIGERDFRGFNYVKVTGPAGPDGERSVTETWFHQGNDIAVNSNNPNVADGYMKGKPYRTRVTDANRAIYTETTIGYASDSTGPYYFNPPSQVDTYNCDGKVFLPATCQSSASAQHIQTKYNIYDKYGNVTREEQHGDMADPDDDRTVTRLYLFNETDWVLNKPAYEIIYSAATGSQVSRTDYYYDGTADCNTASTTQTPDKGNLTRIVRWLQGGVNPEVRMAYDSYGNLVCTRDPKGNIATLAYDSSFTFMTVATNPLGHKTTTVYYGVGGVLADKGLYGQVKSVTDPNNAVTTTEYDAFGRKVKMTAPNTSIWTAWSYPITPGTASSTNVFGDVDAQNVRTDTSVGISTWTYFDGLGRTIKQEKTGPDAKFIVTETKYNKTGTVSQTSLPYFKGLETTARWTDYTYDPIGRVTRIDYIYENPATRVLSCYNNGVTVTIDTENHRRRQTKNAQGKLVKVEEYQGTYSTCSTDAGTPYASTIYEYDVLGNLRYVTDAKGNKTEMRYNTLGQKNYMDDPDMGTWTYTYDANGNLLSQTDAKGKVITFTYDPISRVTLKNYPTGTDVSYTYDVKPDTSTTTTYPVGRVSSMTDASGTTKYFYDIIGRPTTTKKTVDGTEYKTTAGYDNGGRVKTVQYPDNETITYRYNAENLSVVTGPTTSYAAYTAYNALGQPGTATYGNGVVTTYQYKPENNRLTNIKTSKGTTALLNLTYGYSNSGNVISITDGINANRSQTFDYDELYRLAHAQSPIFGTQSLSYVYDQIGNIVSKEGITYDQYGLNAGPHAVTHTSDGKTYTYDANGNMKSDGTRVINYDYDNMPQSILVSGATTTFVYDGSGARVKKIIPSGTTIYIGKLYECRAGVCSKYIFAGGTRIGHKVSGTDIVYYHQDHLGSTRIVTDQSGNKDEDVFYYPFGAAKSDTGAVSVNHKYTSQEFDAETSLYYYNARYYNPALGRFISADTVVPNPSDPQALNRYSYVRNNPLLYGDPSGHFLVELAVVVTVSAAIGGYAAEQQGGDWRKGAAAGAVGGAAGFAVGGPVAGAYGAWVGGIVGGAVGGAAGAATYANLNGGRNIHDMGNAAEKGAEYGAIAGAVGSTLTYVGVPNAIANAAGGYASGYADCGSACAGKNAWYTFVAAVLQNSLTIAGAASDGRVPAELAENEYGPNRLTMMQAEDNTYVTTPDVSIKGSDLIWLLEALLGNGYSHTWHSKDTEYVPSGHYYKQVQRNVPYPENAEAYLSTLSKDTLTTNNCTTRFGFTLPATYSSRYHYFGQGAYWLGW